MLTLTVDLGAQAYPIYIGEGLIGEPALFSPHVHGPQVMVVSNETIAPLYLEMLMRALSDYEIHTVVLPDGEKYKDLKTLNILFDALLENTCARDVTIIALGGGVTGDIAGFAAGCYQRGVNLIQVPTTLLAQVDSSVGGKTAVNHALGKNMIGVFHQPKAVIVDVSTLHTLPEREFAAGIAEVIKYGLIRDQEFLAWLETNMQDLVDKNPDTLKFCIERSCRNKAEVVAADEREKGERALLNLGHTFGHAIETAAGYGAWLHGEAVAAGMVMAADMSLRLGNIQQPDFKRIHDLILAAKLPVAAPPGLSATQFHSHMAVDKKVRGGIIRLVLLRALGDAYLSDNYDPEALQETLKYFTD